MIDDVIAAAYDARATEYIEVAGSIAQMDAADRNLIGAWRDQSSGRMLDAGCGPGLWTEYLYDGHRDVVGVDIAAEFLAAARTRLPHLEFEHASLRDLPFADASFGGILAWYSLIHIPPADIPAILVELARVLEPGGSLLIGYFDGPPREQFPHAVAPAYFWSADALSELLTGAGFTLTATDRRTREPGEVSRRTHGALTAIRT
ncbi:class I SAM-dependent methyltransferase [Microbacterium sp.]|uniref:class I SAM-dependent methyltransferase n=1 Tax=Microbacterium sp. TaxID=51671 RepID=UPI0027331F4E|nr:class I SAM-dependent methyltransferase [Microbacterium sp.]MDP3949147.1 class I SAM-dependent methyltransferase [Microbacterium sp.]